MAYTEGTNYLTEFSGEYKFLWVEVSPDGASGNITLGEHDNAVPVGAVFTEALANTCLAMYAEQDGTTDNKINIVLYNSDGGAATSYKDFRLAVIVYDD